MARFDLARLFPRDSSPLLSSRIFFKGVSGVSVWWTEKGGKGGRGGWAASEREGDGEGSFSPVLKIKS